MFYFYFILFFNRDLILTLFQQLYDSEDHWEIKCLCSFFIHIYIFINPSSLNNNYEHIIIHIFKGNMKCLEWRLIQDPSNFILFYHFIFDLLLYIFSWVEGLLEINFLPFTLRVRSTVNCTSFCKPHLWNYTEYVIIVSFIFIISFYFVCVCVFFL